MSAEIQGISRLVTEYAIGPITDSEPLDSYLQERIACEARVCSIFRIHLENIAAVDGLKPILDRYDEGCSIVNQSFEKGFKNRDMDVALAMCMSRIDSLRDMIKKELSDHPEKEAISFILAKATVLCATCMNREAAAKTHVRVQALFKEGRDKLTGPPRSML